MHIGFELPDGVAGLTPADREARAIFTHDLCCLDDQHFFVRGVAYVPVHETGSDFGWGFWVEVPEDVFEWYRSVYGTATPAGSLARGFLANTPPSYPSAVDQVVTLVFHATPERPSIELEPSGHLLFREQHDGISVERLHQIIAGCLARRSS